ncbi:unnamed protein product, partial [Prunus brigantina]
MNPFPVPLSIVYSDGRHVVPGMHGETGAGRQLETSTSGRGEAAAEPSSQPRVSVIFPSNPRVPMGVPKEHLFGVDYLEPNRITEASVAACRPEDTGVDRLCPWPIQPQLLGSADGSGHGLRHGWPGRTFVRTVLPFVQYHKVQDYRSRGLGPG